MELTDTYKLSEYRDLGHLDERQKIRLMRNRINGRICTARTVSADMRPVYEQLMHLRSPHIPKVYEILPDDDEIVVITEYIDGRTIEELLQERPFTEEEACGIMRSLCEALQLLHTADPPVICRDLKAENVMIDTTGREVIVDFDIARLYREGQKRDTQLFGTQEYAAPEQFGYGQTDARTDIYALGVLLNYMVLRKFPAQQHASGRIGMIVEKCTKLDPDQRYQSAEQLDAALTAPAAASAGLSGVLVESSAESAEPDATFAVLSKAPAMSFAGHADPAAAIGDPAVVEHVVDEKAPSGVMCFLPPGFRGRTWWKVLIAACGYAFFTWFCFTLDITDDAGEILRPAILWLYRIGLWLSQILWIFLVFDYRGIRGRLPLVKSSRRWVRIVGYVIAWCIITFVGLLAAVVLEDLLL